MAFWAYILRCSDGRYYTGHTDNLERRIAEHQTGGFCDFTSRRLPVELVWSQEFTTRAEALDAERRIKPWSRAKKEALIRGDWAALSYFAKPPKERPSTSLGTNGDGRGITKNPLVSSGAKRSRDTPSQATDQPAPASGRGLK
ncbi:GIY-YIG nuclease family protein [Sphingomonas lutea]|uniref:GIY-YIG nuclease family protein n=1 Tax=Sphingomonas lutea TaxID=1045317 RepID=A0A7G9SFE8_9SPHN|nr:GIY-YIG nuclease family protein [Sphingomonas lutea]QNN66573.1 GIY-YIG nuclease family protein [Sphingomonas lutea]